MFYCAGFLRVELELDEQKKRINALESIEETKSRAIILDLVTKSKEITPGKFLTKILKKYSTFQNNIHSHHLPNEHDHYWAFHKHASSEVQKPTDDCVFCCRHSSRRTSLRKQNFTLRGSEAT